MWTSSVSSDADVAGNEFAGVFKVAQGLGGLNQHVGFPENRSA
jgi:hypothetical protein